MTAAVAWFAYILFFPLVVCWRRPQEVLLGVWLFMFSLILATGGDLLFAFQGTLTALVGMAAGMAWLWRGLRVHDDK